MPSGWNPRPAKVPYNDWRQVALPSPDEFTPSLPVSVVMCCYRTPAATLARTLAALEGQTYPRDLFEVVMVDDGSEPRLTPPRSPLNVRVVRQEHRGRGTPRARNHGARAAAHAIVLFLEDDLLVEAGWIAAHARWHHFVSDVVTVGFRAHVSVDDVDAEAVRNRPGTLRELFSDRPADPPWVEPYMRRTNDLTTRADDVFKVLIGGNFGVGREFYWTVGGSDESFVRWGQEDSEFAYRAYTRGALVAPVRAAFAWHQGRWAEGIEAKKRDARLQWGKVANRIAHPRYRGASPGRIYTVPQYVVTVEAGPCPAEQVAEVAGDILADRVHDLVVRIEMDGSGDGERLEYLRHEFGPDPRVRVAPARSALDEFPAAPFHVTLPASVSARDLVHRLHVRLGDAVVAAALLPDGASVSITRSWALHRARRTGANPADFGEAREVAPRKLKLRPFPPAGRSGPRVSFGRIPPAALKYRGPRAGGDGNTHP